MHFGDDFDSRDIFNHEFNFDSWVELKDEILSNKDFTQLCKASSFTSSAIAGISTATGGLGKLKVKVVPSAIGSSITCADLPESKSITVLICSGAGAGAGIGTSGLGKAETGAAFNSGTFASLSISKPVAMTVTRIALPNSGSIP